MQAIQLPQSVFKFVGAFDTTVQWRPIFSMKLITAIIARFHGLDFVA
jgi:hypothetical protein